ncbi:hypothetical protein [Elizabethkingia anophelis]|uniref:Uncharacterized protein n=1 Tax=Elizabethkingia anophelis TaxID=1117645 RepID=A0A494J8W9_9FLAO|nr:hypothetical protein [Elizabethkingia anophelis]AQX51295.1 hypothetical protein AYC66_11670 [Elizabethkingia anophelis]MCT4196722.1 hypothetical protein [Elizabethkingia anophelis]MCT4225334.1 hypothetical protein [Elizabethkingia anophelis]MCT4306925.1 hypothetical protein [Elizabethkingia anophelis]MDV2472685.1 hypothetical protein [Elizabethkingia anophelis]
MINKDKYKWNKYWWLGLLGFVGIYELPVVIDVFKNNEPKWKIIELLWLLWFSYFIPEKKKKE